MGFALYLFSPGPLEMLTQVGNTVLKWKRGLQEQHATLENNPDPKSLRGFGALSILSTSGFFFCKSMQVEFMTLNYALHHHQDTPCNRPSVSAYEVPVSEMALSY